MNPNITKYGYQGSFSEEITEFELNYNEFELRTYDPQIGRWTTPDPYDEFASPFVGMGNDPINNVDPDGGAIGVPHSLFTATEKVLAAATSLTAGLATGMAQFNGEVRDAISSKANDLTESSEHGDEGSSPDFEYKVILAADGTVLRIEMTGEKGGNQTDYVTYVVQSRAPNADGVWTEVYEVQTSSTSGPPNNFPKAQKDKPTPGIREVHDKSTELEAATWLIPGGKLVLGAKVAAGIKFAIVLGIKVTPKIIKPIVVPTVVKAAVKKVNNAIPKGFKRTKKFGYQHGQKVYKYKGKYYSKDVDGHNGGVWKVFENMGGKLKRVGTADKNLNIIKK